MLYPNGKAVIIQIFNYFRQFEIGSCVFRPIETSGYYKDSLAFFYDDVSEANIVFGKGYGVYSCKTGSVENIVESEIIEGKNTWERFPILKPDQSMTEFYVRQNISKLLQTNQFKQS